MKYRITLFVLIFAFIPILAFSDGTCPKTKEAFLGFLNQEARYNGLSTQFREESDKALGIYTIYTRQDIIDVKALTELMMKEMSDSWHLVSENMNVRIYDGSNRVVFEFDGTNLILISENII